MTQTVGKRVLVIGIDPTKLNFSSAFFQGRKELDAATIQAGLDRDRARMTEMGIDCVMLPIDPEPDTADQEVRDALAKGPFAVVVIGAGVRVDPDRLILFERLINLVHERAPTSRIAFNISPDTTAEAAARWL